MTRYAKYGLMFVCLLVVRPTAGDPGSGLGLRLHGVFSDNMVFQRDMPIRVWGTSGPGETVTVSMAGDSRECTSDRLGNWRVALKALPAGGPHELHVVASSKRTLRNVLIGDVWICAGQSNMFMLLKHSRGGRKETRRANYPHVRLLKIPRRVADTPQADFLRQGQWGVCSARTAATFSAAGYYFGRDLHRHLKIPIGLVQAAWGGTPAEAWTSQPTLQGEAWFRPILDRYTKLRKTFPAAKKEYDEALARYNRMEKGTDGVVRHDDPGDPGLAQGWASADLNDRTWQSIKLPGHGDFFNKSDGAAWFRRNVEIPDDWAGKELRLSLGPIDDHDETYFNGVRIGGMGSETPDAWDHPRHYTVPGRLVLPGPTVIAVRVFDNFGGGGFRGASEDLRLVEPVGGKAIALAGKWRWKIGRTLKPVSKPTRPLGPGNKSTPAGLYNGMVHPARLFPVRGVIWYQGEANAWRAYQYRRLLPSLIDDWRAAWGYEFPFLIVQLPGYLAPSGNPQESAWAELREAQAMALSLPATGLAVAIDLGQANDIHPRDKEPVGQRLALAARHVAYGEQLVYSGPTYRSMQVEGDKIRILFDHVGRGLVARGGPLRHFAIAGKDARFIWGKASIDGRTVVVESPNVPHPCAVRYAWAYNPEGCNLYNKEGLPAAPFRTDDWPGATANSR